MINDIQLHNAKVSALLGAWEQYEDRKLAIGEKPLYFNASEVWEVQYLIKKIRKLYPLLSSQDVAQAISQCEKTIAPPHIRQHFVSCVLRRLYLI